jgi:hypothetical protein
MRFSVAAIAALSAAVSVHAQNQWNVIVGANETLTYTPSSLNNVSVGDVVNFQFVSKNHSVTQSTFTAPCTADGVSSGFQNVSDPTGSSFPTWSITIENTTAPLWFFCAQVTNVTTHCQQGMVFAINPTAEKSFAAFQAAAMATNTSSPVGQNPPAVTIISGSAGATDGVVSVAGSSSQAAETASPSSTSGSSGSSGSNSSGSTSSTASSPSSTNGAAQLMSGSSISLLAVAGLVAGLAL